MEEAKPKAGKTNSRSSDDGEAGLEEEDVDEAKSRRESTGKANPEGGNVKDEQDKGHYTEDPKPKTGNAKEAQETQGLQCRIGDVEEKHKPQNIGVQQPRDADVEKAKKAEGIDNLQKITHNNPVVQDSKNRTGDVMEPQTKSGTIKETKLKNDDTGEASNRDRYIDQKNIEESKSGNEEERHGDYILKSLKKANLYDDSNLNITMAYLLMNKSEEAIKWMKKANKDKEYMHSSQTRLILYILCNNYLEDNLNDDSVSKPFFHNLRGEVLESKKMHGDVENTLGNVLLQRGGVKEAIEVLEKSLDDSSIKDSSKITLLYEAYKKDGNETKLQEMCDKYPEIKKIENLENQLKDSEEKNAKSEEKIRELKDKAKKNAKEKYQSKKDLAELQMEREEDLRKFLRITKESQQYEKSLADLQMKRDEDLRKVVRNTKESQQSEKDLIELQLRSEKKVEEQAAEIKKLQEAKQKVNQDHYEAIKGYMRSISRQYSESVEQGEEEGEPVTEI
ncbi:unnamed protein product [Owenia fusiformis]|uniref:Uncharacterized protein n=1 Tax=Owenia fusiformis TaxID=6347 RepID=A0A8S4PHW6_OWEFU|nr:unnamed protein product [Owenia fusiformis]